MNKCKFYRKNELTGKPDVLVMKVSESRAAIWTAHANGVTRRYPTIAEAAAMAAGRGYFPRKPA